MRLRHKPWARPELESCRFVVTNPKNFKGRWKDVFKNNNDIYLELGCGRGRFISEHAFKELNKNFIGIEIKDEVIVYAKRKVEEKFKKENMEVNNVRLVVADIAYINDMFDKDEISRIYLNFSTPWPKKRHNKRRLTHTRFLEKYKSFLKRGSEIWFKTDDEDFFNDSIEYFEEAGFKIEYITYDLHNSDFKENIMTEYETKFSSMGFKIMFAIARYN
ncbi:tRNA (guanine-N(7)-)-methyltransferase [Caloramator quimbayensis]|uniref:tRNA (guanine-N(7)-)-methyltransferase n=1 Tax=Caloramator quimbayensis TaxID=1147123 RepID=A0A1T4XEF4_9CLOT|nr:tRNA (guanosine(46)-N7)-methyltransferase TrmB [Caloramator quimbayensis]SKA87936.1 tRNA (guanine-N(7)-)-methyltransferase [Caloramator quimbayensis]